MSLVRNWKGVESSPDEGQAMILDIGWSRVLVKRTDDQNQNVGVSAELDEAETTFEIRARIDPMTNTQNGRSWIGLVEPHILPLMRKGDRWFTQKPKSDIINVYRILTIDGDEIILDREL